MNRHLKALELHKILDNLSQLTNCEASCQLALALEPITDYESVVCEMQRTSIANSLTNRYGTPTIGNLKNCTMALKKAQLGSVLSLREILDIVTILRSSRLLSNWRKQCDTQNSALDFLFDTLVSNRPLEDTIQNAISIDEEVLDSASPTLLQIRTKIKQASQGVKEHLDKLIRSNTYQKYLQESIVTMRDGRYVVPVKSEHRNEIKGLIHDTSSSGATLFIEPLAVVEANNQIKVYLSQEQQEIELIIKNICEEIGLFAEQATENYQACIALDVYFAKSKLADRMRGIVPILTNDGKTNLLKARHPLIDISHAVPTNIHIGIEFDTLIITGPNTGGKTVAIKTLGLLTAMAMCGLMIPASDGSRICVFEKILVDIGDEQSIEQSLSTFSSHMTNIVGILEQTNANTLVCLDELGAGTDPVEGSALGVAIIEELRKKGAKIACTTHYPEVKMYALQTDGVQNASCEFDVASLRPTYKLLIGVPGRSNAFAISKRLGLGDSIIDTAKTFVSDENKRFEQVVSELEIARQDAQREKAQTQALKLEAQMLERSAREFREKVEAQKEGELEKARTQARSIVEQVRAQSEKLLEELTQIKKNQDSEAFSESLLKSKTQFKGNINKLRDLADPVTKKIASSGYELPRTLKRGDLVFVNSLNKEGQVMSNPDGAGFVTVQAGMFKTKQHSRELRLLDSSKKVVPSSTPISRKHITSQAVRSIKTEVDLRGLMADEAMMDLDKFIDECMLSNIRHITIIHGKGTGKLRAEVHRKLKKTSCIKTYRLGTYGEGEDGVTIAEFL